MKRIMFLTCLLIIATIKAYYGNPATDTVNVYGKSYHKPVFPGDLNSFISKNTHYPNPARDADIEGRVLVSFMVDEKGNVSDIRIKRSLGAGCDEEAERVVKAMPAWKPATYKGKPTKAVEQLHIIFKLE